MPSLGEPFCGDAIRTPHCLTHIWRLNLSGLLLALLLVACATPANDLVAPAAKTTETAFSHAWDRYYLEARFSLSVERPEQEKQSLSGRLAWFHDHEQEVDDLVFFSPFGYTLAHLVAAPGKASMTLAGGRQFSASSFSSLAEEGLGFGLPFESFPSWLAGDVPSSAQVSRDEEGRPVKIRNGVWVIGLEYGDQSLPQRLSVRSSEGFNLRLYVEQWQTGATARQPAPAGETTP